MLWTAYPARALLALSVPQEKNPGLGRGFLHSESGASTNGRMLRACLDIFLTFFNINGFYIIFVEIPVQTSGMKPPKISFSPLTICLALRCA